MVNGLPSYSQSRFPNDLPPTLFSPASPKVKKTQPQAVAKDQDNASIASTSTFASTVDLIKQSVKSKLGRKDGESSEKQEVKESKRKSLPKDPKSRKSSNPSEYYEARARTAEAYMVYAMNR